MKQTLLVANLMLSAALLATAQKTPESMLGAALHQEEVQGDLKGAIAAYQKVVATPGVSRKTAAEALVRMGQCYEKLGDAESRKAYERVVREYADQKEMVAMARARLGGNAAAHAGIATRQVWTGPNVDSLGTISSDGRYLSFVDWATGDLALHYLITGKDRNLTNKGSYVTSDEEADASVISPDGKQVAYSWFNKDFRYQLRVMGLAGDGPAAPQVLSDNEDIEWIGPYAWSGDGQWIAVQVQRKDRTAQIGLVATRDGSLRVLKSVSWRLSTGIFFSPDGKYLAFDLPSSDDSEERDVFVLAVDGSREIPAVVHPAYDVVMGWTPDGQHLLFASDRTGSMGLWALPFREGKPQGPPALIKSDIGQPWALGLTHSGALYFGVRPHGLDLYMASLDFQSGVLSPPVRAIEHFVGANRQPDWSPDGKYLAYLSRRDPVGSRFDILAIRSVESGQTRELRPKLVYFFQPRWAPDGRSLAVQGQDHKGRQGIYRVDAQTGEANPIVQSSPEEYFVMPEWAPDGKNLFYRRSDPARKETVIVERDLVSGRERELLRSSRQVFPLSISPDGRYLACTNSNDSTKQAILMVIPVAGGEPRELLRLPQPQEFSTPITWTPDSRSVLFRKNLTATLDDSGELWLAPLDGAPPRRVALNVKNVQDLRFHEQKVVFTGGTLKGEVWVMENLLSTLRASK